MKNLDFVQTAYTHGSVFHADDVFAAALLLTINPGIHFERIFKVTPDMIQYDTIVFDIGEGEYDHHQKDKAFRPVEDGTYVTKEGTISAIPYCSFGLLWRDYGTILCPSDKAWKKVDRDLVIPIDKADNGVAPSTLSNMISKMNPTWKEKDDNHARDEKFMIAVIMAKAILNRYVLDANAEAEAEDEVLASRVIDGKILVLNRYLPWQDVVINHMPNILFVVFPSARGGYNVQTVPDAPGSFTGRKLFPTEWLGNPDTSLGMTFCHPGNFLLSTETIEQAINVAKIAVDY